MLQQIEHIGIAVTSLAKAIPTYEALLGVPCYKQEKIDSEAVMTAFFRTGNTKIELLEALSDQSPIHRYIARHGEGMHHVAYLVDDIRAEMDRLRAQGHTLLQETPKEGADHKWVCFLHPKSCHGVLTELCQERD